MSDYQVTNYGICGECKYHVRDDFGRGWVCTNENSDYVAEFTDYDDLCEQWEKRGVE